jgi:hypothetical protein
MVDELHVSLAAGGASVCEGCYCASPSARMQPPPPGVVKLREAKPPGDPAWIVFRKGVIERMERDGAWHYIEHDRCVGLCPVCLDRTLSVHFIGHTPEADWTCGNGCDVDVAAILARLGKAWL